jgi:hypothetical protein
MIKLLFAYNADPTQYSYPIFIILSIRIIQFVDCIFLDYIYIKIWIPPCPNSLPTIILSDRDILTGLSIGEGTGRGGIVDLKRQSL